jgi:isoleucyl-tRNA synthetase
MKELMAYFHPLEPTLDFGALDAAVLSVWEQERTFLKSVERRPVSNSYVFYDGPPFATGLPHYGHVITSIIKDVIPRVFTMNGCRVERRFGWDCHGVPVEFELEKELHLQGKADIERMGVAAFNEACRSIVLRYTQEWESVVTRVGRWVDFRNDYKTMDLAFMETVWWVFKRLWDMGLVYKDYKVVHYSWRLATPLSNFEATLDDAYREREDPAVTVKFQLEGHDCHVLAWTTTPWTLPSNMALAVNPDMAYAKVRYTPQAGKEQCLILASDLTRFVLDGPYEIEAEFRGERLVGRRYEPLLPYFRDLKEQGAFRIIAGDFVTSDEGTGVVHLAPAFGEDDFAAAKAEGIPLVNPVDDAGRFTKPVQDFAGMNVFDANPSIIQKLKAEGQLFSQETILHAYPHDWRTDTPLIYRAIPSWYVNVTAFKERMLANNEKIAWYPSHVKRGAFGQWLENARDWAISRNRYWGTPIPVWSCDTCEHTSVMGSLEELQEASGNREIKDIHCHFVDDIEIPCPECHSTLRRVPEVLDCWFESGSMPYGQVHYPFENQEWFDENFPADFIVEYIGQTRGWFYTLIVLSSALFDQPPFRNALVHGVLLAEDGRKMSKRLRNYPEPTEIMDLYGADALRLYLMHHPVIDANDSRFDRRGVAEMLRKFIIPVWNAFSFLTRYADIEGWRPAEPGHEAAKSSETPLDRWVRSRVYRLSYQVGDALRAYDLRGAVASLLTFVDDLNNWYIRRSRARFWKATWDEDKLMAFETLHEVLVLLSTITAPLAPFATEVIFKNLTGQESVHLVDWPEPDRRRIDPQLEEKMDIVRQIASLGLAARAKAGIKLRQPLVKVGIRTDWTLDNQDLELIRDELNVKQVELWADVEQYATVIAKPNPAVLGPKYKGDTPRIIQAARAGEFEELADGRIKIGGSDAWTLPREDVEIHYEGNPGYACEASQDLVVVLDVQVTQELEREGLAREIVRHIQILRKEANYRIDERITAGVFTTDPKVLEVLSRHDGYIRSETLSEKLLTADDQDWDALQQVRVNNAEVRFAVRGTRANSPSLTGPE